MTIMETLKRILEGAFLLAVITQAVSLTDFFLLPAQKKRLEGWVDEITLRLSFINTAGLLQRWLRASRRAQIGVILFGILTCAAIFIPPVWVGIMIFSDGFSWIGLGLVLLTFVLQ
jgi:hypothetical protein